MAAKKITKKVLGQLRRLFRRDMATLEAEYGLQEIADRTGIGYANLSSYKSDTPDSKQPGVKVLRKFYAAFKGELENPFDKIDIMEDEKVNDNQQDEPKKKYEEGGSSANFTFEQKDGSETATDEQKTDYKDDSAGRTNELIETLKTDNAHLRTVNHKLLDSGDKIMSLPHKWLDSLDKMVATHAQSNQAILIMAETHRKIIDRFLGENGGQQA